MLDPCWEVVEVVGGVWWLLGALRRHCDVPACYPADAPIDPAISSLTQTQDDRFGKVIVGERSDNQVYRTGDIHIWSSNAKVHDTCIRY